jgi:hypothetical protein
VLVDDAQRGVAELDGGGPQASCCPGSTGSSVVEDTK